MKLRGAKKMGRFWFSYSLEHVPLPRVSFSVDGDYVAIFARFGDDCSDPIVALDINLSGRFSGFLITELVVWWRERKLAKCLDSR